MDWSAPAVRRNFLTLGFLSVFLALTSFGQSSKSGNASRPWMNSSLSPDERAVLVLKEMTLDEKISLLHGTGMSDLSPVSPLAVHSNGGG